jgi:hypothetical protein
VLAFATPAVAPIAERPSAQTIAVVPINFFIIIGFLSLATVSGGW